MHDFDLFVIGAGSGGVAASRRAASHGARVAICEDDRIGGTCVIRGCIPKKLLAYAAHFGEDFEDAAGYGWTVDGARFDWARLIAAKDREIDRLNGIYKRMLGDAGVTTVVGRGRLVDRNHVSVGDRTYSADTVLIASGGAPTRPRTPGIEHSFTSNEAFHLERLPEYTIIVGGGYIALEFASIFRGLGAAVTILYRGPRVLRGFDDDVRETISAELGKRGIDIRCETEVARIERRKDRIVAYLAGGGEITGDGLLYATGRAPNTAKMGLAEAGVRLNERGAVVVDGNLRTSVDNIFAIGDVTDRLNLTPVAIAEGRAFADTRFGDTPREVHYDYVPSAVFCAPQVAQVGLNETQARARGGAIDVYRARFRPLKHTLSGRDEITMMKLIVDADSDRVLGCHIVGADAAETIQAVAVTLSCGATKAQFDATIALHPSSAEELVLMRTPLAPPAARAAE